MIKIADNYRPEQPGDIFTNRLEFLDKYLVSFLVFWCSGALAVLVDFDHFEKIVSNGLPIISTNFSGRALHIFVFIFIGIIWLYSFTYVYRLYAVVLEEYMEKR